MLARALPTLLAALTATTQLPAQERVDFTKIPPPLGLVAPGARPVAAAGVCFLEGPAVDATGAVFFSDIAGNRILRLAPDGIVSVFRADSGRTNGNTFDAEGRLISCEGAEQGPGGRRRIVRTDMKTGRITVLTDRYDGKRYNSPNDVCVDGKGRVWFTDPYYGTDPGILEMGAEAVYRIDPDGKVTRVLSQPDVERPNGIAITPDAKTLYVIDSHPRPGGSRKIWAFTVSLGGALSGKRLVYDFGKGRGGDGMRLDQKGNLWVAAGILHPRGPGETTAVPPGVYVLTPEGRLLGRIPIPEDVITNLAFGGRDRKTLYVTAGKTLYKIPVQVAGYALYPPVKPWIQATAFAIPKETAPEGEGYFSIVEGHNGRLYVGTHANAVNCWLVEFDPKDGRMRVAVDAHRAIGTTAQGFAAQAKIHTRNNVGASGKVYFGTKQGYPAKDEKRTDYPGGYPMVYDPQTDTTKVYPIPVPHQGIISITPDESRGVAYLSTCSDERPADGTHFGVLDLKTGRYRDLMDCRHMYAFVVVDYRGRAYHPVLGGDIARYDSQTGRLERLKQTINGKPPTPDSHLADPNGHPINWDVSPDGKTLYALPMSGNRLYRYDLTAEGEVLAGRDLGPLLPGASGTDCRALCVGPRGTVWAAVTEPHDGIQQLHLVRYRPGDEAPHDLGPVAIRNPDYTAFTDANGKPLPYHDGLLKTPEGVTTTRHVTMGVCEARDGSVYVLALHPYTLLRIGPDGLK